jgi:LysR family transcriptional regulator of beta-lactamase
MERSRLPLNALRAFEAAARHLNVTRAALELRVTQAAVSHHIKILEEALGAPLFRRLPRGLTLTDEGAALAPMLNDTFDRMAATLGRFASGRPREIVNVGVVGTFATGWLLPRLAGFEALNPYVDLRIMTNNNRVDLAGEGLDLAIRFGDGAWHGTDAVPILDAPMTPLCAPGLARRRRPLLAHAAEVALGDGGHGGGQGLAAGGVGPDRASRPELTNGWPGWRGERLSMRQALVTGGVTRRMNHGGCCVYHLNTAPNAARR